MLSSLATFRPVAYQGLSSRTPLKAAVLHTNGFDATDGSLFSAFSKNASGANGPDRVHVGAHFQVKWDGSIDQYIETDFSIGHAFAASRFAIGIETEDDGRCLKRWTDEQVSSIIELLRELEIPPQLLKETPSEGVGWHRQFPSWNLNKHACPCDTRIRQIETEIIPGLEDDMSKANEYFERLEADGLNAGQYSAVARFEWGYQRGLRKLALGAKDGQDPIKRAGFERGRADAAERRGPAPGPARSRAALPVDDGTESVS